MTLKEKIVDAAYELFGEKGYEKTSVAEIIDRAGASKGGFYHHFKSKEEILETISFNYVDQIRKHYDELLKDDKLSVVEKFMESFSNRMAMFKASFLSFILLSSLSIPSFFVNTFIDASILI